MENSDGVVMGKRCREMLTEGRAVRACVLHTPYGAAGWTVWPCWGVCSILPHGTMAGDVVRGSVVIAAAGWDGKQPGGQRAQICKELVLVSSTIGIVACLLHCLAGREGRGLCFCVVLAGMCNPGVLRYPGGEFVCVCLFLPEASDYP